MLNRKQIAKDGSLFIWFNYKRRRGKPAPAFVLYRRMESGPEK